MSERLTKHPNQSQRLLWRILLLFLDMLQSLQSLLHARVVVLVVLRRSRRDGARTCCVPGRWVPLQVWLLEFVAVSGKNGTWIERRERRSIVVLRDEQQFARGAVASAAHHDEVVAGADEESGENLTRITWAVNAKDARAAVEPDDGHGAGTSQILQDLG